MLEKLRKLNPTLKLYDIYSEEFKKFGRVIDKDLSNLEDAAKKIDMPEKGVIYRASVDSFESLEAKTFIEDEVFGTLDTQIGYCYGYNSYMNATEWHHSSELNVAITPIVLILGFRGDVKDNKIKSSDMVGFYVPKGAVVEVFATSTHFCPCQVSDEGFGAIVALPKGTNTPLEKTVSSPIMTAKNKWLISHVKDKDIDDPDVSSGIFGENYRINY